jgi:hypothetical protein
MHHDKQKMTIKEIHTNPDIAQELHGEDKMENLSIEAKEIIDDLFEKGHTPREIKAAMEDGAFLESARISQEIAEEIHNFLSNPNIFEADEVFITVKGDIDRNNYKEYIGKKVNVTGDVDLSALELTKLPITFGYVKGSFTCVDNNLTSLEGAPEKVGEAFACSYNKLTSLEGAPTKVGGDYFCSHNQLTTLEGAPTKVGMDFYCSYNELTTLEGAPKEVGMDFYCLNNPLKLLTKGLPEFIGGKLYID